MQNGDRQVSRGAKPVKPDIVPRLHSRHPKAAEADDAGAEEWRRAKIIESCRE
jgi:hypothetical protein